MQGFCNTKWEKKMITGNGWCTNFKSWHTELWKSWCTFHTCMLVIQLGSYRIGVNQLGGILCYWDALSCYNLNWKSQEKNYFQVLTCSIVYKHFVLYVIESHKNSYNRCFKHALYIYIYIYMYIISFLVEYSLYVYKNTLHISQKFW